MKRLTLQRLSLTALLSLALAGSALAAVPMVVNQTYNSGYNSVTNTALAPGSSDLYFNLYSYVAPTPVVVAQDNPAWVQTVVAQWIAPNTNESGAAGTGSPAGGYTYEGFLATDFLMPTTVTMTLSFAADDGTTLAVDGTVVDTVSPEGYIALTPFSYSFTLGSGPREIPIDFFVNNLDSAGGATNSTGLLISNLKFTTGAAPEPSTWALMFLGLGAVVLMRRLRLARSL